MWYFPWYRNFNKFPWIILTNTQVNEKLIKGEQAYSGGDLPSESPLQRSLRSLPPLLKADKFDSNRGEQRSVEGICSTIAKGEGSLLLVY